MKFESEDDMERELFSSWNHHPMLGGYWNTHYPDEELWGDVPLHNLGLAGMSWKRLGIFTTRQLRLPGSSEGPGVGVADIVELVTWRSGDEYLLDARVTELKNTKLRPKDVSQCARYMSALDRILVNEIETRIGAANTRMSGLVVGTGLSSRMSDLVSANALSQDISIHTISVNEAGWEMKAHRAARSMNDPLPGDERVLDQLKSGILVDWSTHREGFE